MSDNVWYVNFHISNVFISSANLPNSVKLWYTYLAIKPA